MRIQVKCIYTFIFMHLIIPALCTFPYSVEIENGVFRLQLEHETREVAGLHCEEANSLLSCEPGLVPAADAGEMPSRPRGPRGGIFHNGLTAWQVLTKSQYSFLKKSHGWRLDKWDRMRCVSWCLTLMLRHANSCERDRPVRLMPDGHMLIEDMLTYRMFTCLDVTANELRQCFRQNRNDGGKRRFMAKYGDDDDEEVSLAAVQGHSGAAHAMLDDDQHLTKVVNVDQIPRI